MKKDVIKKTCNKIIAFSLGIIMVASMTEYGYCENYQNNTSLKGSIIFDGNKYKDFLRFERKSGIEKALKNYSNNRFLTKRLIVKGDLTDELLETIDEKYVYEMNDEYTVLSFAGVKQTEKAYETLLGSDDVDDVFGENVYEVNDEITEDDFFRQDNLSWGSDYVNSPALIDYINENAMGKEIKVAVIDTGINMDHSRFKDRICEEAKSFVSGERTVEDYYGHGSHVAGIIADNTPDCVKILPIKAISKAGRGSDTAISEAIDYAIEQNVDVINMSLGGKANWDFSLVEYKVKEAKDANIAVVVSAGNDSANADRFSPARCEDCITVSASNENGGIAGFSNYGECIDVAAPGVNIYSTFMKDEGNTENYDYQSGTSMATPFVSSAISMIKMLNSDFTVDNVEEFIENNVTRYNVNSVNKNYGTGIIDFTNYSGIEKCSGVVFDHLSGRYDDEFDVELSNVNNGEIYYTLDGSNPTKETANLYTEKIHVDGSVQIKAIAYADGLEKSKITKASYRFDDYDFDNNFFIDDSSICGYRGNATTLKIKDNIGGTDITKIGYRSFRKSSVTNIELPDSITEISTMAFCKSKLKSISAANVKFVGSKSFQSCSDLVDMDGAFAECIYVGEYAFEKCEKLTRVYFPNCITFGDNAFSECKKMKTIYAPKCENVSCDYGRVLTSKTNYRSSYNNGYKITSNISENIDILVNNYVFEKVKNGESINVPADADVYVLYKGSFKKIFADGKEIPLLKSKFTFNINSDVTLKANISNDVSDAFAYISGSLKYSGKELKPDVSVELNGLKLVKNVDYTLTYKDNVDCGIAEIVIEGIGDYKGSKSLYFYIEYMTPEDSEEVSHNVEHTGETENAVNETDNKNPCKDESEKKPAVDEKDKTVSSTSIRKAKYKKKKIILRWKKNKNVDGYEIQIGCKKSFKGKTLKLKINKNNVTKKIIKKIRIKKIRNNLKKKKKVYVRIRTYVKKNGQYLYSKWSKVKRIKY